MTTPNAALADERYLADRFEWAAPGDRQRPHFILRFDDNDRREMHFKDEGEAWAAWNQYAPSYNVQLFQTAALRQPSSVSDEVVERLGVALEKAVWADRQIYWSMEYGRPFSKETRDTLAHVCLAALPLDEVSDESRS